MQLSMSSDRNSKLWGAAGFDDAPNAAGNGGPLGGGFSHGLARLEPVLFIIVFWMCPILQRELECLLTMKVVQHLFVPHPIHWGGNEWYLVV